MKLPYIFEKLYIALILIDACARAMIDPLVECRKLWGGPFNPNFDVCQNLEDTLTKVNHNIYFLSKGIKTRNIGLMFHCFNVSVFL